MDQGLHGLVGQAVGFLQGLFPGETLGLLKEHGIKTAGQKTLFFRFIAIVAADCRPQIQTVGDIPDYAAHFESDFFRGVGGEFQSFDEILAIFVREGFADAVSQGIIEVRDTLAAVLVVLVRLDGDAGERRVTGDVVGLAQETVAGGKTVLEQFLNIDLTAGRGQGVKIKIVDMNVAVLVRFGMFRLQYIHFVVDLGAFRAVFQHGTHGGIAVDVGVVALQVAAARIARGDFVIGFHQAGIHFPRPGPFGAVQDVGLGGIGQVGAHENLFDDVLDLFDGRRRASRLDPFLGQFHHAGGQVQRLFFIGGAHRLQGFQNGVGDFFKIEGDLTSVPFDNGCDHVVRLVRSC